MYLLYMYFIVYVFIVHVFYCTCILLYMYFIVYVGFNCERKEENFVHFEKVNHKKNKKIYFGKMEKESSNSNTKQNKFDLKYQRLNSKKEHFWFNLFSKPEKNNSFISVENPIYSPKGPKKEMQN